MKELTNPSLQLVLQAFFLRGDKKVVIKKDLNAFTETPFNIHKPTNTLQCILDFSNMTEIDLDLLKRIKSTLFFFSEYKLLNVNNFVVIEFYKQITDSKFYIMYTENNTRR